MYTSNTELNFLVDRSRKLIFECIINISGIYPEPYIFIRSVNELTEESQIKAVDLLTHDSTVVAEKLWEGKGLAIHIEDNKLYFGDGNRGISRANLDGSGREVILKNANVYKMAIDWIGRRIFWTKLEKRIFVVNMDGKHGRTLINTQDLAIGIAVDPLAG
jgi:hypothetical protein